MHKNTSKNDKIQKGLSLLYFASKNGNPEILKMVLSEGINVNAKVNGLNTSALYLATENNKERCIKLLVDNGADVNIKPKGKPAPIILAAVNGNEEIVKLLLDAGAKVPTNDEASEAIAVTSRMAAKYYEKNNNKNEEIRHYIISKNFYDKASKEYEETSKEYNERYKVLKQKRTAKEILNYTLMAFAEWGQQYQARERAKQTADIQALLDANKMGLSQMQTLNLVSQYRSAINVTQVTTDNRLATTDYYYKPDELGHALYEAKRLAKYFAEKSDDMKKCRDEINIILKP